MDLWLFSSSMCLSSTVCSTPTKITPAWYSSSYYSNKRVILFVVMLDSMPHALSSKNKHRKVSSTDTSHSGVEYSREDGVPRLLLVHLRSTINLKALTKTHYLLSWLPISISIELLAWAGVFGVTYYTIRNEPKQKVQFCLLECDTLFQGVLTSVRMISISIWYKQFTFYIKSNLSSSK